MKLHISLLSLVLVWSITTDIIGGEASDKMKCGFGIQVQPAPAQVEKRVFAEADRPDRQHRYLVEDPPFLLHYDSESIHAIDMTIDNATGLPVWIVETEAALKHAWHLLVDSLQFDPPPMDKVAYAKDPDGGAYDIYFRNFNFYGFTHPEDSVTSTERPYDFTGYMEVENDFQGFPTEGIEGLRVTIAHELFHLFHLGYAWKVRDLRVQDLWWYEISSSWFEDVAYPSVNDYVAYVSHYFQDPRPLHASGADRLDGYRVAHYGSVLSDYDYPPLWEKIWSEFTNKGAYEALDLSLRTLLGSSFTYSLRKFAGWNFFTGDHAVQGFGYPDAVLFPTISTDNAIVIPDSLPFSYQVSPKDIRYYQLERTMSSMPYFSLLQLGRPDPNYIGGVLGLDDQAPELHYMESNRSLDVRLERSGYNGLIAAVNSGTDSSTFTLKNSDELLRPYPNPLVLHQNQSNIHLYTLINETTSLEAEIYNLNAQRVYRYTFPGGEYPAGTHSLTLPLQDQLISSLSNGVYIVRLKGKDVRQTAKITILR
ncbi:MAG TPA: MXAN_6640 family putative metalloprotease [bacterium]|nr:MXAN_6640 family putative metalloprotease [bacterium]